MMQNLTPPYVYIDGVVAQELAIPGLPHAITLDDKHYRKRSHLHCTIVAVKKLIPQIVAATGVTESEAEKEIMEVITQGLGATLPLLTGYSSDIRVVSQPSEHKQTIIVMAKTQGFEEFFAFLNHKLQLQQPTQPAHVTLYAVDDRPIGLNSPEEVAGRTRQLSPEEQSDWARQINPSFLEITQ